MAPRCSRRSPSRGSALHRKIRIDPYRHPLIEWRWQVPAREPGASPFSEAARLSAMARVSIAFHGDEQKLDVEDRAHLRIAKVLTPNGLPYATLVYVGCNVAGEPVQRSRTPLRGRKRRGAGRRWIDIRRDVVADYRHAFGEDPGDIVAVGVMTDSGDDGSIRRAFYGDITFRSGE